VTEPAEPFTRASLFLGPVFEQLGLRIVAREYDEGVEASAFAEYALPGLRVRLVWEGADIEWSVAGRRLEVDHALDDDRLDRLGEALVHYLALMRSSGARAE
jgi:hypothetical protein